MPESTALVPVPFYAPVRTGTGASFKFGETSRRPMLLQRLVGIAAPEPDEGLAYSRNGRFVGDTHIGTRVNVFV